MPHPRGKNCFVPLADYPFAFWKAMRNIRTRLWSWPFREQSPISLDALERVSIGRDEPEVTWTRP